MRSIQFLCVLGSFLGGALITTTAAHAELPTGLSEAAFDAVCNDFKAAAACESCKCEVIATTDSPKVDREAEPDIAYALIVSVVGPGNREPTRPDVIRQFIAVGSATKLHNAGLLHVGDSSFEKRVTTTINPEKLMQFNDVCLTCDHENARLVHLFDLTIHTTTVLQREDMEAWENIEERRELIACFGAESPRCFATPVGHMTVDNKLPQIPGEKLKRGKKKSWKRSWKIGGRNKMEVVLGPISGTLAAEVKKTPIQTDLAASNFSDLPSRASARALPLK